MTRVKTQTYQYEIELDKLGKTIGLTVEAESKEDALNKIKAQNILTREALDKCIDAFYRDEKNVVKA